MLYEWAGGPAFHLSFFFPYHTEGAPSFAESAVLVLRSEQRVGLDIRRTSPDQLAYFMTTPMHPCP